jgi:acyl-coenzyme A thioesterase PaaI-like protein
MPERLWEDDQMCFACGTKNPAGLHLQFTPEGEQGLRCEYVPGKIYQSFKDVVHGGFIGLLLDEVIVNLPWLRSKLLVVTAELTLRLYHPAPVEQLLIITACYDGEPRGRLVRIKGEVRLADGTLIAAARAKCMKVRGGKRT